MSYAYLTDRTGGSNLGYACLGSQVTLSIYARNSNYGDVSNVEYKWAKDGATLDGQTSATLTTTQPGLYSSTLVQAGCTYAASSYQLYQSATSFSFYISTSSSENIQCDGQSVGLTARYVGDNATYQWKRNDAVISGATSATYTVTQTGRYAVSMQDGSCSREIRSPDYEFGTSIRAVISFNNPGDSLACSASHQTQAFLSGNSQPTRIQWYKNGNAIAGATSSNLNIQGEGVYYAAVQRGGCQTVTNALNRKLATRLPVSITYRGAQKLCSGDSAMLYTQSLSYATYQWQRNGVTIPNATNTFYRAKSSGEYTVRVAVDSSCTTLSAARSLTFSDAITPVLTNDNGTNQSCGGITLYPYSDNGVSQAYSYQWFKDDSPILGATTSSLYASSTGLYKVRMTKSNCSGTSKGFYLQTGSLQKPVVSSSQSTVAWCANEVVLLETYSINNASFQWK